MFLINSRSHLISETTDSLRGKPFTVSGAPSPEVTVPFCLVPSPGFSQAPWYSLPDHLCRFGVRFQCTYRLGAFPGSMASTTSLLKRARHRFSALRTRICLSSLPTSLNTDNQRRDSLACSVPPSQYTEVQEY